MNDARAKERHWLHRFATSGWLSLCVTLIAAPPVYYVVHWQWGIDWFYTAILGAVLSVAAGHLLLLVVALLVLLVLRVVKPTMFREVCPACGERALKLGMRTSHPTEDPTLHRVYVPAECHRCRRRFQRFVDGSYHELREKV